MKSLFSGFFLLIGVSCEAAPATYQPREGDLVFHTSRSGQSEAIQLATGSPWSHLGIVVIQEGEAWVFEAVQPVRLTPLQDWIQRGVEGRFVAKRLHNAEEVLTPATLQAMLQEGMAFKGKDYDLAFGWSDERLYCSELVWKIYQRGAGVEIGALQKLRDFDRSHPAVARKLQERYGRRLPLEETVISPAAMFESRELITIYESRPGDRERRERR